MSLAKSSSRPSKEQVLTAYRCASILDAARKVFGDCGFDRATIDAVAHEAGVAKGTIYLYYDSKQRLYDEALNAGLTELGELTRIRLEQAPTLRDAITAFVTTRAEYFDERRDFFRMYVMAVSSHLTEATTRPSACTALIGRQTGQLETVIARAVARREIRRVDPAAVAIAIFDLTRGVVARRLTAEVVPDLAKDAAWVTDLIWSGLERHAGAGKRKR
jgi:AcrR family transcriptional regulator